MTERVLGVGATCCGKACELCAPVEEAVEAPVVVVEEKPRKRKAEEDAE